MTTPGKCSNTQASLLSSNGAAGSSGFMHAGAFPHSCTRPSTNSRRLRFRNANGQEPSTISNENAAPVIIRPSAHSPSDGFLFRLWKTGEEYDENRYIEALKKKQ